jgi:hypothetical protein
VPFGPVLLYRAFKQRPRNKLQDLIENAAYSIRGGTSVGWIWFWLNPAPTLRGFPPPHCSAIQLTSPKT